jgi:hypothetical protein
MTVRPVPLDVTSGDHGPLDVSRWARAQTERFELPRHLAHTLLVFASYCDGDAECYPSLETVARACGVKKRTIAADVRALKDIGLITCRRRRNATAIWTLCVPWREVQHTTPPQELQPTATSRQPGHALQRHGDAAHDTAELQPTATRRASVKSQPNSHISAAANQGSAEAEDTAHDLAGGFVAANPPEGNGCTYLEAKTLARRRYPNEEGAATRAFQLYGDDDALVQGYLDALLRTEPPQEEAA